MSWSKKVRKPADVLKTGETVEVVVLGVNPGDKRISLGLKQALGDPWAEAEKKFQPGTVVEAPVVSLTKFGAFVQIAEALKVWSTSARSALTSASIIRLTFFAPAKSSRPKSSPSTPRSARSSSV